jgi:hypothetical protein
MKKLAFLIILLVAANVLYLYSSNHQNSGSFSGADSTDTLAPDKIHSGEGQLISTLLSRYHYKKFKLK